MPKSGFSLLELSVVLVIISLIVGGVMMGQNLLRGAEMRNMISEFQTFQTGFTAFRDKYDGLPGDLRNATEYWGAVSVTPSTCFTTVGVGTQTCDGNGDNIINSADGGVTVSERFRFWQQLALAGFIEGSYIGVTGGGGSAPAEQPVVGVNVPEAARDGLGFYMYFVGVVPTTSTNWFRGTYGNMMTLGGALGNSTAGAGLLPEDASDIDVKFDDGRPGTGIVVSQPNTNLALPNCTTSNNENTANYNFAFPGVACSVLILME